MAKRIEDMTFGEMKERCKVISCSQCTYKPFCDEYFCNYRSALKNAPPNQWEFPEDRVRLPQPRRFVWNSYPQEKPPINKPLLVCYNDGRVTTDFFKTTVEEDYPDIIAWGFLPEPYYDDEETEEADE